MENTINILQQLIKIPSYVDSNHDEHNVIEFIKNYALESGVGFKVIEQQVEGARANLLIHSSDNPEILLFGHMDTVLPKQDAANQFNPRLEGDSLYGLGSVDMKAGLAIMLDIMRNSHNDAVAYVFSVDEEYDFKGVHKFVELFPFNPKLVINVEPTSLEMMNGCRGITEFNFEVIGKSAHAGRKQLGINAIEMAVNLVGELEKRVAKFDTDDKGHSSVNLAYLNGGIQKVDEHSGEVVVTRMGNVVPDFAEVTCEIRVADKRIDETFVKSKIDEIAKELGVSTKNLKFKFYYGSMFTDKSKLKGFEQALKRCGLPVEYKRADEFGFFEVQILQEITGCDCVIFGPGPASKAHMADEYVDITTVEKAQEVIENFISDQ